MNLKQIVLGLFSVGFLSVVGCDFQATDSTSAGLETHDHDAGDDEECLPDDQQPGDGDGDGDGDAEIPETPEDPGPVIE